MESDQIQILELMAQNEEILSELYMEYAKRYPEYKQFWIDIANDELVHAKWIRELSSQINSGNVSLSLGRFNAKMVFDFAKHGKDSLEKVRNSEPEPILRVMQISLAIEKSFLEKDFFRVAETDALAVKETLYNLAKATEVHIAKIENEIKKIAEN